MAKQVEKKEKKVEPKKVETKLDLLKRKKQYKAIGWTIGTKIIKLATATHEDLDLVDEQFKNK